jgi:splicing factor 3A subunit 3
VRRLFPSAFYDRLKEVRDAHRHFPNALAPGRDATDAALAEETRCEFTGEEGGGRYLDLHELYRLFTNAPFGRQVDYLAYLDALSDFGAIARPKKFHKSYAAYLSALTAQLLDFRRRSAPLAFPEPMLAAAREAFAAAWDAGSVPGWEDRGVGHAALPEGVLDLDVFESADELLTLGPEALKDALARLGLKAGGTDADRAARLFSTKGKRLDQLDKKLFQRGAAPPVDAAAAERAAAAARAIAALEAEATCLAEALRDVIKATRGNCEKKTTLSYQELEAERMEEDFDAPEDGEVRWSGLSVSSARRERSWDADVCCFCAVGCGRRGDLQPAQAAARLGRQAHPLLVRAKGVALRELTLRPFLYLTYHLASLLAA